VGRWFTPALAFLLAALLVVGGVAAWAARSAAGLAPYAAPRPVPAQGAGPGEVELSADAGSHPAAEAVREQLQRHFDAINSKDYQAWTTTVVPERVERLDEAEWRAAYSSTTDGTIRIDRIDPLPAAGEGEGDPGDGVLVRVRFVSTQNLEDAPPDLQSPRICWRSTLPMRGMPPLIDVTGGGSSLREAC
jgi:hypothetical protein